MSLNQSLLISVALVGSSTVKLIFSMMVVAFTAWWRRYTSDASFSCSVAVRNFWAERTSKIYLSFQPTCTDLSESPPSDVIPCQSLFIWSTRDIRTCLSMKYLPNSFCVVDLLSASSRRILPRETFAVQLQRKGKDKQGIFATTTLGPSSKPKHKRMWKDACDCLADIDNGLTKITGKASSA